MISRGLKKRIRDERTGLRSDTYVGRLKDEMFQTESIKRESKRDWI